MNSPRHPIGVRATLWRSIAEGRRSVRRYHPEAIDAAVIKRLIEAATLAPSAHNRQPWRFAVITDFESKHRLAVAMGDRLRQDRHADGDAPDIVEQDVRRSYARLTEAPLLVVVCTDHGEMDTYPDEARRHAERIMAVQSTAMAMQNLLLAAHAEGLGACVMCAPLFCADAVVNALGLPAAWEPQAIVTVGRPANSGKPRSRKPLHDIVWYADRSRCES